MTKRLISIFIPAYNEESNIAPLTEKINKVTSKDTHNNFELIIVNDGSSDKTLLELEIAEKKYKFVNVISHKKNLGLTETMKSGFAKCKGEYIVFLPADLESDPEEDIPKLVKKLDEGLDLVAGWRQGRDDGKLLASKIYNVVSKSLFDVKIHDMNWIKAFKREVLDDIELRSDWHRFIVMMAANKGYKIGEVKTNWYPRNSGKSKFGFMRFPKSIIDVLVVKFNMMFGSKPMQFFSMLGSLSMIIGFLGLIFLAIYYFTTQTQIRPLFTLFTMLIIAGLQLFVTGFLAELVVSQKSVIENLKKSIKNLNDDDNKQKTI
ncbi:MAG: glycosyltransferase family 2 protein [Candidatus Delongbacteria bacterium]|nr:glycosyltransferase family 2 protein [Candidatus Delongbacteria bacterium]